MSSCKKCELYPDICHGGKKDCGIQTAKILASWDAHDDPEISTEMQYQMVADDCGCSTTDVSEALWTREVIMR